MHTNETIKEAADELCRYQLVAEDTALTYEQLHHAISEKINFLINHNFSWLISLMYRLDISEKKLKALLSQSGTTPAGDIIAALIIERQLQKIETRKAFKSSMQSEEEKW